MSQARIIRSVGIGLAMSVSLCWSFSYAEDTISNGGSAIRLATSNSMTASVSAATEAALRPMPSAIVPIENGLVLRTLPTMSKPISVGGRTLVPYIGAGFGGGYATELDRSLNISPSESSSSSSGSSNTGLRSLFGHNLIPNEVQLGIRFPF